MNDVNNLTLTGRLVADPKLSYLPSKTPVCNFRIAANRSYKKGEEWQEEAVFLDIDVFGNRAESLSPRLCKGKKVLVTGSLKQRQYEKNGVNHTAFSVFADAVEVLELVAKKD